MRVSHPLAAVMIAAAVSSCNEDTGPRLTRYELAEIDGAPLPKTLIDEVGKSVVSGGAVYLSDNGNALRVERFTRYPQNGVALPGSSREPRQYRVANDSIAVGDFASCTASCQAEYVGRFSHDELTLSQGGQGAVYRYRRAPLF
jgi:hypothetical protein